MMLMLKIWRMRTDANMGVPHANTSAPTNATRAKNATKRAMVSGVFSGDAVSSPDKICATRSAPVPDVVRPISNGNAPVAG